MPVASRTERTEARLLPEQKKRIEQAAIIKGMSISDFIVQNADEAAIRTIRDQQTWTLETQDRDRFVEVLLNPPAPSSRLKESLQRHRERIAAQ